MVFMSAYMIMLLVMLLFVSVTLTMNVSRSMFMVMSGLRTTVCSLMFTVVMGTTMLMLAML